MRVLSRSDRNTVKAIAYRTGTDLYDERTGKWFYHSDKDVAHVELLLPKDAPAWAKELQKEISEDRQKGVQKLSDLAEAAEKRKNSQVYREFEFALPKELTKAQNIKLANEFLQDQACGRGMMVVASFHFDADEETGEQRPHCHALLMTRRLDEQGFSHKEREWNKKSFLLEMREQWAAYANFHLKLHGHDVRIDHRSYADQGIDIAPQPKLARNVKTMEDRTGFFEHKKLEKRALFEAERHRNVARLIKKPTTVFDIVTRQQSTFMWGDVEKVLARYVREEDIFCSLKEKLQSSRELVLLREEERVNMDGLKEDASIYTTQSMIRQELSLVSLAESLGERQTHATREEDVEGAIDRANERFAKQGSRLSEDQEEALRHITKADQLSCIIGYAGAGKSTTFKAAKEVWEASGYRVYGLAPTGRAAQNLEEIGVVSTTLHEFLKAYSEGRSQYRKNSVLVLDEAGMVDVRRFNDLLSAVDHLGVKLVISGDGAQSQPIEAGPGFRLVTDRLDVRKIETIVRQNVAWQKEATRLFGTYQTREALGMYLDRGHVQFVEEKVADLDRLVSQNRHRDVVELYTLSRRVCGTIWHTISEDLKELKIPQKEFLKTAIRHKDFALFQEWQHMRQKTADHMVDHIATYRTLMKEKGVDPVAFAASFVNKDMPEAHRQSEIRRLIKSWGLETPDPSTPFHQCDPRKETRKALVQEWQKSLKAHPGKSHLMVTYTNRDTHLLNEEARALMRKAGVMAIEEHFHTIKREGTDDFGRPVVHESRKAFSKGERLVFTENNNSLGVKNGTLGTIEEIDKHKLKVRIDGDNRVVSFASRLYPYFDRGWAVTIIKSQGSTADRGFKLATFEEDRNLAYVGMTRHRESLQVFGSKLDFWREEIFTERLSQNREKLASTDYVSREEAQSRLKPPARLMDALSSLGNRLESLGYYSRKGWESVCERFLGQTRPEDRIMFARSSLEESRRALEMGINAAPSSGNRAEQLAGILHTLDAQDASSSSDLVSGHASAVIAREEDACPKAMVEKQNDLRNPADHPESVLSPLSQSTFQNAGVREGSVASSGAEKASPSAVSLPVDISAFVDEQAKVDASQKATPSPDVREQGKNQKPSLYRAPSMSKEPYYSLEEVRRSLTSYGIENICTSLLGEPNQRISTRRHLRYGNSGSLAVSLSGSSLGLWKDHSRDEGGDLFKLVQRERGGDFREALAWVAESLRVAPERSPHQVSPASSSSDKAEEARRLDRVNRLLESSRPLEGTLGERYLRTHRGIQGELSSDLRFIPAAWNSRARTSFPALAALARNKEGAVTAVQLVYLNAETGQKAACELKKQSFGLIKGSYVQIQKGSGAVFVAEGVETALSIREAGVKRDIYAALGVANFRNLGAFMSDRNRPLIICADQDGEGSVSHKAVEKAVQVLKAEGLHVCVIRPDDSYGKADFNDILKREEREGIKKYFKDYLHPPRMMSERDQRIFSYLEKAINEDPYTRQDAKEDYLRRALKSPDDMLRFWQSLTGDRSFMPDGDPRTPEELAVIERYRQSMASEKDQMRQERVQKEQVQKMPSPEECSPPAERAPLSSADSPLAWTDVQRPSDLQKLDTAVDASLPSSLQEGVQRGQNIASAHAESLKLETDVQKFIRLSDRAAEVSALVSGESKTLYPVMDEIIAAWKDDERFTEKVEAFGNRRAAQYVEQYHIEQKRLQERNRGNAFEM